MQIDRLVEESKYIVEFQAYKAWQRMPHYVKYHVSYNDLKQEGWIAFIKAVENYDETKGAAFNTFLTQNLIYHFTSYLVKILAKKRQPLAKQISLQVVEELAERDGHRRDYPGYQEPKFAEFEFFESLRSVQSLVSDTAKELIRLIFSPVHDYPMFTDTELMEIMNTDIRKVRAAHEEIYQTMYQKPMNGRKRAEA